MKDVTVLSVAYEHISCAPKNWAVFDLHSFNCQPFANMCFFPLTVDVEGSDVLFISFIGAGSVLQLALIKVNDVQTLIINCAAYLLFRTGSLVSKGKILYVRVGVPLKMDCFNICCNEK